MQTPAPSQVSRPLAALPSEHEVPAATGEWTTPVAGLHESAVHGLPSFKLGGVPGEQCPVLLHVSRPLQALPSEQDVPHGASVWVQAPPEQASTVQGFPSSGQVGFSGEHVTTHAPSVQVNPQTPAVQLPAALGGDGHTRPQEPQCATLVRTSVSHPLASIPSQLPRPAEHAMTQAPAEQLAAPPADGQRLPQLPQLATSLRVLVQKGMPASAPQSAVEGEQVPTHWPL